MENKRNIGFLINNLGFGGAERVFVTDANKLASEGHNIYLFILYGNNAKSPLLSELSISANNIFFLNSGSLFNPASYLTLYSALKKYKINVLYSTLNDAVFVSRIVSVFIPKIKLVTREANTTENKSFFHKISDQIFNIRVNKMMAVSDSVKKSMLHYQFWYKSKIEILHNGVSIPSISKQSIKKKIILSVGSLTPKKSHRVLIEAFSFLANDFSDYSLNIIGTGVLENDLKLLVENKNLRDRVNFLGNISHDNMGSYYERSEIFVLSSNQEGCPNVLLEAMSYGLPSVATSVGAIPEIITDGVSGFIVPKNSPQLLSEAISKLIVSEELRNRMGIEGRKSITNNFSDEKHFMSLKKILLS